MTYTDRETLALAAYDAGDPLPRVAQILGCSRDEADYWLENSDELGGYYDAPLPERDERQAASAFISGRSLALVAFFLGASLEAAWAFTRDPLGRGDTRLHPVERAPREPREPAPREAKCGHGPAHSRGLCRRCYARTRRLERAAAAE